MIDFWLSLFTDAFKLFDRGDYGMGLFSLFLFFAGLIVVALIGYGIVWLLFNRSTYSEEKTTKAKVVKVSYVPEHGGTHVAPVFTSNGFGTAITSDYEEEKDIVVLRSEEIGRLEIDSAELLEVVDKGDMVNLVYQEKYSHWAWNPDHKSFDEYVPLKVKAKDGTEIEV